MNASIPIGRMPDPRRVHGAWVYLFAATGAGALVGSGAGVLPALLAGTTFAGLFLLAVTLAIGLRGGHGPWAVGLGLSLLAPSSASWLGAQRDFLWTAFAAVLPAVVALAFALRHGWLAPSALACGVLALTLAAPAAARAGGASWSRALALFATLLVFFEWRTLRIALSLRPGSRIEGLNAQALRAQGLREAGLALAWTTLSVVLWA